MKMEAARSCKAVVPTCTLSHSGRRQISYLFHMYPKTVKLNVANLDDWLTECRSITSVNFQLDAQNSYLFTHNTFIKILFMFPALPCLSSGGLRRNCIYMQPLVSSLSAGDCPVHRVRKFFLNRCTGQSPARYHRLHIYSYDVDLLKMSRVMLETCRGF